MKFIFAVVAASCTWLCAQAYLGCVDDNGNPVDSWTSIKAHDNMHVYYYSATTGQFEISSHGVDQTSQGAIMKTLTPLYDTSKNANYGFSFYNDNPPGPATATSTYAHGKGVLATDGTDGFWLVHSMPAWPDSPLGDHEAEPPTTSSPNPGVFPNDDYAQSLACVTITVDTVNDIANTLRIDYPMIYGDQVPSAFADDLGFLTDLNSKKKISSTNVTAANTFYSKAGVPYIQFAKSRHWGMDLWDDLIAPYYKTPMFVETWINGQGGPMSSMCYNKTNPVPKDEEKVNEPYDIYQVGAIKMPDGDEWSNTRDHSKWGISKSSEIDNNQVFPTLAVCVGDINRMCSQEKRGGGAMCTDNAKLNKAFTDIIYEVESCYYKDPCDDGTCYWCNNAALTYPPTYYPTGHPTATPTGHPTATPTDDNSKTTNGLSKNQKATLAIGSTAGVLLLGCAFYHLMNKGAKKSEAGLATHDQFADDENRSSDGLPRRASFEVDVTSAIYKIESKMERKR